MKPGEEERNVERQMWRNKEIEVEIKTKYVLDIHK